MNGVASRTRVALALQLLALAVLVLAWLGTPWLDPRSQPRLLVLVDRSQSVPQALADKALVDILRSARLGGAGQVQFIEFAGKAGAAADSLGGNSAGLDPAATDIEAALQAALVAHGESAFAAAVMVSDGHTSHGDTPRALRAVREARLPLQWLAVGRPPPEARIQEVAAPVQAQVGQPVQLQVQVVSAGRPDRPLRVQVTTRHASGETQQAASESSPAGRATVTLDAPRAGALLVDVRLEDAGTGALLDTWPDAAVIDIAPRADILYAQGVQGVQGRLASSLQRGGWSLNVVPASRLDAQADSLDAYRAVVLDDITIADASPRFWQALVAAVQQRGLGLVVLGGERSFALGGYRGSTLESVLPVLSEPSALDEAAAVVFAVDKSGSMGQGSGGVDRLQLAQRAVLETARGLGERDALGLVVFDVAPRVLIPLGPAAAGTAVLARDWPVSPNGGTQLAPALEAAVDELQRATTARRLLVLVTDGYTDGAPLDALIARLTAARVEIVALAVGPDADVAALERVLGPAAGSVLRVDQAAELPVTMRSGLERRRARVERGRISVAQRQPLPFAPGLLADWPAVAGHHVTRAQTGATVAVQSERGEPVIAHHMAGRGRVVVVTSGLGPWTPDWLGWREWPRLAGGLAGWASGNAAEAATVRLSDAPAGLWLEADLSGPDEGVSLSVDTPQSRALALQSERVAPGRLRAALPDDGPGLYTVVVSGPRGTQRFLSLRRAQGEHQAFGLNPALAAWQAEGLLGPWTPGAAALPRSGPAAPRPPDRALLGAGLLLFLLGVVVDRTPLRWSRAELSAVLKRWRQRLAARGAARSA